MLQRSHKILLTVESKELKTQNTKQLLYVICEFRHFDFSN